MKKTLRSLALAKLHAMTLRKKTFYLYMANMVFFLVVISIYLAVFVKNDLMEKETTFLSDSLHKSCRQFSSNIDTYNRLSNYIFNDNSIQSVINQPYSMDDTISMYQAYENVLEPSLNAYQMLTPNVSSLLIYTDCGLQPYKKHIETSETLESLPWYPMVKDNYNMQWLQTSKKGQDYMISVRKLGFGASYTYENYLVIEIPSAFFFSPFLSLSNEAYWLEIKNENHEIIYRYNGEEPTAPVSEHSLADTPGFFTASEEIPGLHWTAYYYKPAAPLWGTILGNISILFFCFGGVATLLLFITYSFLRKTIIRPIEALASDMQVVQFEQQPHAQFHSQRTDEIGILMNNYHDMLLKINSLINEVYVEQINAKEYQLKVLRAQINPHFLYNILSLISAKAIMAENHEINKISFLLSRFYRTCLNEGKDFTTVYNEIENIKAYVEIQLIMNNRQFKANYSIDENVYCHPMPNLILQPIVENAIMHGLNKSKRAKKKLTITAALADTDLRFTIEDNGAGIPQDKLNDLLSKGSSHFGLRNIDERLGILFADRYRIKIESEPTQGTRITIVIPASKNEDVHDESEKLSKSCSQGTLR